MKLRRSTAVFILFALVMAFALTRGLVGAPNYTDAYYHFNAAVRIANGEGLTEPYLWTYIGAPESLPESGVTPSHLYWMPMTSLLAAAGMKLLNAPGDVAFAYGAAQVPLTLMFFGTACVGYGLGKKIGGGERHAWVAGLLTLFSGFYTRFWGMTDTFAPYALLGSLCLLMIGEGAGATQGLPLQKRRLFYWSAAGALAALAHLTRADGVLLLLIGYVVIFWGVWSHPSWRQRLCAAALMTAAYLLVMLPWFARNLNAVGSPLPLGGAQSLWFTQYDDLFNYPPEATAQMLFSLGIDGLLRTRWEAFAGPQGLFSGNFGTFIAVEGLVVMTPLMLIGVWQRRKLAFLRPFWLYALGLHVVMTLIFPYPGYRGGLLHSAAALVPWWAALGAAGLDDVVNWIARRRRHWNPAVARWVFSAALVGLGVFLSLSIGLRSRVLPSGEIPSLYAELQARLPADARIIVNDPAALYYYTGMGGVVTPNAEPSSIEDIARRYHVDYLLLEPGGIPGRLLSAYDDPPPFLTRLEFSSPDVRLYAIHR
jgi:hypothetical protein